MANFKLIAFCLALTIVSNSAMAGFQSMRPPPGYSRNSATGNIQQPGWGPSYKPAPGEFYDLDKKQWMSSAKANIGGRELSVPVAMPIATGVNVALSVATAFSSNPAILVATAAWALYQAYLATKNITPKADGTFEKVDQSLFCETNCYQYQVAYSNVPYSKSASGAITSWASTVNDNQNTYSFESYDPSTSMATVRKVTKSNVVNDPNPTSTSYFSKELWKQAIPPWSEAKVIPYTPQDVGRDMAQSPMPQPLQDALPYSYPVAPPVLNPDASGNPKITRIPLGSPSPVQLPSPNPENLPQTWKTPVIDLIPSPTVDDPWRIETVPRDIVKTSPSPIVDPLNPNPTTGPIPTQPETEPGTKTAEKQPSLCEQYPDILACAKPDLNTPDRPELETKPKDITYAPQSGWGGGGGACPAPRHLNGAKVDFEFTMFCNFMSGIKPIVLAFASLAAGMIIIGARGGAAE